jgi:hypothetical protein
MTPLPKPQMLGRETSPRASRIAEAVLWIVYALGDG